DGSEDSLMDGSFCIRPWSAGTVVGTGVHNIDITPVPGLGPAISSGRLGTSDSLTAATAADAHSSLQPFTCAQYLIKTLDAIRLQARPNQAGQRHLRRTIPSG